jgi:hypothetical protein
MNRRAIFMDVHLRDIKIDANVGQAASPADWPRYDRDPAKNHHHEFLASRRWPGLGRSRRGCATITRRFIAGNRNRKNEVP